MRSGIVEELRREHAVVLERFNAARVAGLDSPEGRRCLELAKKSLLAHLAKEDRELYPVLERAAQDHPAIGEMLELFLTDIRKVSSLAVAFFERFDRGVPSIELARDFGSLVARLKLRISNEETVLYAQFEQLVAANPALAGRG